jgi:hypothetical protein
VWLPGQQCAAAIQADGQGSTHHRSVYPIHASGQLMQTRNMSNIHYIITTWYLVLVTTSPPKKLLVKDLEHKHDIGTGAVFSARVATNLAHAMW